MYKNMKKYWKLIVAISALVIIIAVALWFLFPEWSYINSDIEKTYCKATLDDNFAEDTVLILLTNEASLESVYYDYIPADFAEIGCVEVQDLSSATTAHFRAQLKGELKPPENPRPGQSWFYQEKDVTTYRRILSLKLKYPSKLSVLIAIKMLEHRADIYSAEPNYIYQIDFP